MGDSLPLRVVANQAQRAVHFGFGDEHCGSIAQRSRREVIIGSDQHVLHAVPVEVAPACDPKRDLPVFPVDDEPLPKGLDDLCRWVSPASFSGYSGNLVGRNPRKQLLEGKTGQLVLRLCAEPAGLRGRLGTAPFMRLPCIARRCGVLRAGLKAALQRPEPLPLGGLGSPC